jgi:hypothetical protein
LRSLIDVLCTFTFTNLPVTLRALAAARTEAGTASPSCRGRFSRAPPAFSHDPTGSPGLDRCTAAPGPRLGPLARREYLPQSTAEGRRRDAGRPTPNSGWGLFCTLHDATPCKESETATGCLGARGGGGGGASHNMDDGFTWHHELQWPCDRKASEGLRRLLTVVACPQQPRPRDCTQRAPPPTGMTQALWWAGVPPAAISPRGSACGKM